MVSLSSRCADGLHLVKQRRGRLTECKYPEVHSSRSATKPSHGRVKAADFFVFLLQASISGAGELCVRFTFAAMLCAKVTPSPACVKVEY